MSAILENKANAVNDLQKKYRLALSIIALLTVLSQFAIQYNIHKGADDSRVINIAGRQRMLSQKITKSALAMQFSDSVSTKVRYQNDLKKAVETWKLSHLGLKYGNPALGLPGTNSAKVNEMFEKLESKHQEILYSVNIISKIDLKNLANDSDFLLSDNIKRILQYEAQFLKEMDAIVFQYDSEAKAKIEIIKYVEIIILFFTLLVFS